MMIAKKKNLILLAQTSLLLPLLKLVFQVQLQRRKLVLEVLSAPPTLHVPAGPRARVKPRASGLEGKLVQTHQETRVETKVMLLALHARRVHVPAEDVHVHVVHGRMRMHARNDIFFPVTTCR